MLVINRNLLRLTYISHIYCK